MVRLFAALLIAVSLVCFSARAAGETHKVSDIDTLADILANKAEPGDVVEIQPGTYVMDRKKISIQRSGTPESPIVIRGVIKDGKRPVFDGCDYNIQRGIFHFEPETHDVVMEDLELRNARGKGRQGADQPSNAAACYILGTNITMRNCYCHHNENGLFSTHESDYVLIENCEIAFNGRELGIGDRFRTHGFYFNSKHQTVKNCYIHDQTDSENFKSRGDNTIFAFNWVEEEVAYSLGLDSNSKLNTLWLGNVVIKRTYPGINQGRLLGVGDGTGVATGMLVALNNTFLTVFPRDFYLFTFRSSTTDVIFINNVFAGPGKVFMEKGGQGAVTGSNNWIQQGIADVPDTLVGTISGEDPGFVDLEARDLRPRDGSPLVDAGCLPKEYRDAVEIVLLHATSGSDAAPSPEYLEALKEIAQSYPAYEPARGPDTAARKVRVALDIGAFEFHGAAE
ncbi:MAG: right-handed parallel beta-helix repeat-containing protein [Planctomycetota bacterium]|jgi:hypothetical protein